jgi:hypothetical protein
MNRVDGCDKMNLRTREKLLRLLPLGEEKCDVGFILGL